MNGYPAELKRRLEEKVREERAQAKLLIGMGIPFAAGALLVMTFGLSMVLTLVGMKYLLAVLISFVVVAVAMAMDTWFHPSPHWQITRFYLAGSEDPLTEGSFISMSDPAYLAATGEKVLAGCTNLVLGGPRNIRAGIEQIRAVRAKSDERVESAAVRLLAWLKAKQPVTQEEVAEFMKGDPLLRKGFALASELRFISRRKEGPQRLLEMKE